MITGIKTDLKVRVDLETRVNLRSWLEKSKIIELGILRALISFVIALLFYVMVSLEANSLSKLLRVIKSYKGFF